MDGEVVILLSENQLLNIAGVLECQRDFLKQLSCLACRFTGGGQGLKIYFRLSHI